MNSSINILLSILILLVGFGASQAQESNTLEIMQADSLKGAVGFERLLGNIKMKNQSTLISCDSAHFFRGENRVKLYGNVWIEDEEDSVTTSSAYAEYDGNTKIAKLRNEVVLTNVETMVFTDYLDFDRISNIADYFNGGKVVDTTNVLLSEKGRYEVSLERITFREDVVLINPDYTLKTNYLVYLTIPKTAETKGLTNLKSKEGNTLDAQNGSFYDTQNKNFRFFDGIVETPATRVKGGELIYRENEAYFEGNDDVQVFNKERNVEIYGDKGRHWEDRGYSQVFGNALVRKYFEKDTLLMAADTLISQDHASDSIKYLLAFSSIRLIHQDMSAISDSLSYNYSDSTIRLFQDPVVWSSRSQITADSMKFYVENEELKTLEMRQNSIVASLDTLANFNQMKGRTMVGDFEEGRLETLRVDGNGESLYYLLEGDSLIQGVNRTISATIFMSFQEGNLKKVKYGVKPEGRLIPVQDLEEEDRRLEGFVWRAEERPDQESFQAWRPVIEIDPDAENLFDIPDAKIRMPTDEEIQNALKKKGYIVPLAGDIYPK